MLVLTRKLYEKIMIGEDIVLTVTRISRGRVTIGINAPGNVSILRGELGDSGGQSEECPISDPMSPAA